MTEREIWLPSIFGDNMMLQADVPTVIWGHAEPRERIVIEIAGARVKTTADAKGDFRARLRPLKAGGPFVLKIRGGTERTLENVLVGDLWLCSGQSNMDWSVSSSRDADSEIAGARFPKIRLFSVAQRASLVPCLDVEGKWAECSPQTVGDFSATAYFFGREVHQKSGRPLGLINASWGGTKVEPWISPASLKSYDGYTALIKPYREYLRPGVATEASSFHKDRSNIGVGQGWATTECSTAGWKTMQLPCYWTGQGIKQVGAFWFRKTVNVPASWKGEDLYLSLGPIVDFDTTYFNGVKVGGIGIETKGFWDVPRKYLVPAALVKPGRNCIAVRVFAHNLNGGFGGKKETLQLSVINKPGKGTVALAGTWNYRIERALPPKGQLSRAVVPGTLYNAMIHPLVDIPVKRFLWYQGESNVHDAPAYRKLFPLLITDWRKRWGRAGLPFYFAQLPDYGGPVGDNLALLREAQLMTLKVPQTGMAVIVDGGERDVHPRNKQLVGHRLALQALAKTYGKKIDASGPLYKRCRIEGPIARIEFEHVGRGLKLRGGKTPSGFMIAGADRRWVEAEARVQKDTVLVWSPEVSRPRAVRYAWGSTPPCTLYNQAGLPASPFRTDGW